MVKIDIPKPLDMTADRIGDWDAVFKKGVRSKDMVQVGIVVGTSGENIVVEKGSRQLLMIPKQDVEAFDGNEVLLTLSSLELAPFEQQP